ncbi:peptidase C39 family protein [Saccharomonospora marina]|uniref:peptidase C39 family protein n=1 Tax=Saccharomonospora marina TaxID=632569 RepID=UPI0026D0BFC6
MSIHEPVGTVSGFEYGYWTCEPRVPASGATELIASWNARTPEDTWLRVEAAARTRDGEHTRWYVLADWAYGDRDIRRTSVAGQRDAHGSVDVDTLAAAPGVTFVSYRLRVTLHRREGSRATPTLTAVGAMASRLAERFEVATSEPQRDGGFELAVPRFAQYVHRGRFVEYGGGGEHWCSPAATEMVVEYWGKGPSERELSWLPSDCPDPGVVHAARHTYDYAYQGTGNWPFNTAYAAHYGLNARVTRLPDLAELRRHVASGVPVITSLSFRRDELDGAGYGSAGHLMVVAGFTDSGDVIVNDPAGETADAVRRVYPRAQFETAWQRTRRLDDEGRVRPGPGGIVYLITP